jgi:hypothetical protein
VLPAVGRFLTAFAVAYFLNLLTVFGFRDIVGLNSYLAQASGVIPYTISFYLLSAYYVFPTEESARATKRNSRGGAKE